MTDHLKDPQAVSWEELAGDFAFTDAEKDQIREGAGDDSGLPCPAHGCVMPQAA